MKTFHLSAGMGFAMTVWPPTYIVHSIAQRSWLPSPRPRYDKCGIFAKQDLEFHAGDLIGSERQTKDEGHAVLMVRAKDHQASGIICAPSLATHRAGVRAMPHAAASRGN